jgi:hypothetical protein
VVAPLNLLLGTEIDCAGSLLKGIITQTDEPVLFIENKLQYLLPMASENDLREFSVRVNTPK